MCKEIKLGAWAIFHKLSPQKVDQRLPEFIFPCCYCSCCSCCWSEYLYREIVFTFNYFFIYICILNWVCKSWIKVFCLYSVLCCLLTQLFFCCCLCNLFLLYLWGSFVGGKLLLFYWRDRARHRYRAREIYIDRDTQYSNEIWSTWNKKRKSKHQVGLCWFFSCYFFSIL